MYIRERRFPFRSLLGFMCRFRRKTFLPLLLPQISLSVPRTDLLTMLTSVPSLGLGVCLGTRLLPLA